MQSSFALFLLDAWCDIMVKSILFAGLLGALTLGALAFIVGILKRVQDER